VLPEVVIEIKMFPAGMTGPQHRVHYEELLTRDLKKLGSRDLGARLRFELIYDEVNYLGGRYGGALREDLIVRAGVDVAQGTNFVFLRKARDAWRVYSK